VKLIFNFPDLYGNVRLFKIKGYVLEQTLSGPDLMIVRFNLLFKKKLEDQDSVDEVGYSFVGADIFYTPHPEMGYCVYLAPECETADAALRRTFASRKGSLVLINTARLKRESYVTPQFFHFSPMFLNSCSRKKGSIVHYPPVIFKYSDTPTNTLCHIIS
jgi:hypothetical protein